MRVLIYIVCYNAEHHIGSVLERIPAQFRSDPDIKVLISDDCSSDDTARVAWQSCTGIGKIAPEQRFRALVEVT